MYNLPEIKTPHIHRVTQDITAFKYERNNAVGHAISQRKNQRVRDNVPPSCRTFSVENATIKLRLLVVFSKVSNRKGASLVKITEALYF